MEVIPEVMEVIVQVIVEAEMVMIVVKVEGDDGGDHYLTVEVMLEVEVGGAATGSNQQQVVWFNCCSQSQGGRTSSSLRHPRVGGTKGSRTHN